MARIGSRLLECNFCGLCAHVGTSPYPCVLRTLLLTENWRWLQVMLLAKKVFDFWIPLSVFFNWVQVSYCDSFRLFPRLTALLFRVRIIKGSVQTRLTCLHGKERPHHTAGSVKIRPEVVLLSASIECNWLLFVCTVHVKKCRLVTGRVVGAWSVISRDCLKSTCLNNFHARLGIGTPYHF